MLSLSLGIGAALLILTLVHVYRGGRTLNDHVVAVVVAGTHVVWMFLALGAWHADAPMRDLVIWTALAGQIGVWGLFFVLDRRVEVGRLRWLALWSQPAHAFALWTGLLLLLWLPVSWFRFGVTGSSSWPGWWLCLPAALTVYGSVWTLVRSNRRTAVSVQAGSCSFRIVQLSDLHASPVMPGDDLCDLMRRTNQEQPDLVAITGDLLMPFSEGNHSYLLEAISLLEAPVFVVPGNHDLPVADKLAGELRSLGCVWLADEQITIDVRGSRVEVVGLDFRWSGGESHMCRVMEACPPTSDTSFRLLLAHDPRMFRHVPPERFHLVLSGHTHGGQVGIDLSWLRWSVLGLLGVYDGDRFEDDSTVLYVHRGNWHTGWPPRMGIAGELAVIDVTPELA